MTDQGLVAVGGSLAQRWADAIMTQLRRPAVAAAACLAVFVYFGLVPPVFPFDNQNSYLLTGLAWSGYGHLSEDWLSNARTPFVAFSAIVAALSGIGFLEGLRVLSFLLVGLFAASCLIIFMNSKSVRGFGDGAALLFVLALTVIAVFDRFLLWGMAGQYTLGIYAQPSEFGVLLVFAVALFVARRPLAPYLMAAAAGLFHPSYLLAGAFLVIAFAFHDAVFERRWRRAAVGSAAALIVAAPVAWYAYAAFAPSDPEAFAVSRQILAVLRIPHHALPQHWFDRGELIRVAVIVLATALAFVINRRLGIVMALASALGALATAVALAVGSNALYLLFPWRITVVLMPLATVVMATGVVRILLDNPWGGRLGGSRAGAVAIGLAAALAAVSFTQRLDAFRPDGADGPAAARVPQDLQAEYLDMVRFVREHGAADEVYLYNPSRYFSFRIRAGQPAFADFKSHPYRDVEVVEWWDRLAWSRDVFRGGRICDPALWAEMRRRGITHVVFDKVRDDLDVAGATACIVASGLADRTYDNDRYGIVRVR